MIHQFMQPVVILVQIQSHDPAHQNPPQRHAQQAALAIGEPLLDDLIAADGVVPHGFGNVLPISRGVEVDVVGLCAERTTF